MTEQRNNNEKASKPPVQRVMNGVKLASFATNLWNLIPDDWKAFIAGLLT